MTLRPLFPFQQTQCAQVFPLKPVPFCKLYAGLGSTNKSASSLLLLSDSCSVLPTLSSSPSFLLPQTLWQIWQELSSLCFCSIRLQWIPDTRFSRKTTRLMSWPDGVRYSCPLQFFVISLVLSLVSTLIFSRSEDVLSHRNSSTQPCSCDFHRGTCSPWSRSLCCLSSTLQRIQTFVKLLSL